MPGPGADSETLLGGTYTWDSLYRSSAGPRWRTPTASATWPASSPRPTAADITWWWSFPPRATPPTISSPRPRRSIQGPPSVRWTCCCPPASRSPAPCAPWPSRPWAIRWSPSPAGRRASAPTPPTPTPASRPCGPSGCWPSWTRKRSSSSPASRASTSTTTSPPWAGAARTPPPWPWPPYSTRTCARSTPTWTASSPPTPAA